MINFLVKKYKRFILYMQIITVLILLPLAYNFLPINTKIKTFYLSSSQPKNIVKTLKKHGYRVTVIDEVMLALKSTPQVGWYTITDENNGRYSFFTNLYTMQIDTLMNVVIYAGETKEEISRRLGNDMKLSEEELLKQYISLSRFKEGDILAGNYTLARQAEENATMQYLFYKSFKQLENFEKVYVSTSPNIKNLKEALIIASIIQKESNSLIEMPLISAVIHNRLNKNMHLQMDATLNYGPYAHTIVSTYRIKNDTSLYNTYKHKGLPPYPLSSITIDALHAAGSPTTNNYLFFMLTPTGAHDFSATYKEHLEKIATFRQYQEKKRRAKNEENNESNASENTNAFGFKGFKKFKI